MSPAFAGIAFAPSVKAVQTRYGSRRLYQRFEQGAEGRDELTEREREFIESRDSFYQATVSETGWPYVQFRGGPPGFLKVLDSRTIGFADFRGNLQYISVGNLGADGRVALILVDYANRQRLKIWGRARIAEASDEGDVAAALTVGGYKARVERAIVIAVSAFDWNCPQHITRRYTASEVAALTAPLVAELEALRARVGGAR